MIYTKTFLRVALVIVFIVVMSTTVGLSQTSSKEVKATGSVIHQLRIYEIFDSNKTAFHERFRDHAMRIMGYGNDSCKNEPFALDSLWERGFRV